MTKGSERMKQIETNQLLRRFKQAFSEETITEFGHATGLFKRERKMTPMKMIMRLMSYGLRDEEYLRLKILTCMLPDL